MIIDLWQMKIHSIKTKHKNNQDRIVSLNKLIICLRRNKCEKNPFVLRKEISQQEANQMKWNWFHAKFKKMRQKWKEDTFFFQKNKTAFLADKIFSVFCVEDLVFLAHVFFLFFYCLSFVEIVSVIFYILLYKKFTFDYWCMSYIKKKSLFLWNITFLILFHSWSLPGTHLYIFKTLSFLKKYFSSFPQLTLSLSLSLYIYIYIYMYIYIHVCVGGVCKCA